MVSEEPSYYDLPEVDSQYVDKDYGGSEYVSDECGWEGETAEQEEETQGEPRAPYFARPDQLRTMQALPLGDEVTICCHIKG